MFEEERKIQIESPYAFNQPIAKVSPPPNLAAPEVSNFATDIATSLNPEEAAYYPHLQEVQVAPAEPVLD